MAHIETYTPEETWQVAARVLGALSREESAATVLFLRGDLGSGKTTFVKGFARALGVEEAITSPTFVIEKIYQLHGQHFKHLIHIDAYRLESGNELKVLGFDEQLKNPQNCIVIEWPEHIEDAIPEATHEITFTFINETTRRIESDLV